MKKMLPFLCLLCCAATASAQMQVEVIPLKHRTVEDVIPVLQPLLDPGGALTGMNNQLVVKTNPENLAEIRDLLAVIDRGLRSLLITVTHDLDESSARRDSGLSGRYDSGDVRIESGDGGDRRGTSVTAGDRDGNHARYSVRDRTTESSDHGGYSVRTLEGQAAFIESGVSLPLPQRNVAVVPGGVIVEDTVEYHDAASGFYVLPQLSGEMVTLLVSPYMARVQGGRRPVFDVHSAETTVSGRLGEWIQIGGIDIQSQRSGRQNLESHSSRRSESRQLYIRVEEVP